MANDFVPNPRATPSIIDGIRGPEQLNQSRVRVDMQDDILMYMPSASPLTTLTGKLRKKRKATNAKFEFLTRDEQPRTVTLSAASLVADTTLDVQAGQGTRIAANYTLLNLRTREVVLVTGVSTDQLTVTRGIGSTQQDMDAGDTLVFLRPVYEDGAGIGTLKTVKDDNEFNYVEIIRTPFGVTGRMQATGLYGGKDLATERKVAGIEHAKSIEQAFFFGTRHTMTGTHQRTFTGGLEYFLRSNVWNVGGTAPTERAFVEYLEEAMKWGSGGNLNGSSTKYLFASARWLTEIEFFAKDKIQYRPMDKVAGLKVGEYVTTHGTVILVKCPILDYNHPDMAFLIDLNHVRYVYLDGRDTRLLKDREANDLDAHEEEYMSDVGIQVELEAAHSVIKGLN